MGPPRDIAASPEAALCKLLFSRRGPDASPPLDGRTAAPHGSPGPDPRDTRRSAVAPTHPLQIPAAWEPRPGSHRPHTSTQRPSPPVRFSLAFCTSTSTCRGRRQGQKVSASTHTTKAAARLKCSVPSHQFGTWQLCLWVSIFLTDKTFYIHPKP